MSLLFFLPIPRGSSLDGHGCRSILLGIVVWMVLLSPAVSKVFPNGALVWDGNGWLSLVDDDTDVKPPPPKSSSWRRRDTTIFVGVSSFRDRRCPQTLVNYYTKAKYPKRVVVGVVQQNAQEDVDCVRQYCEMMGGFEEGPLCPYYGNIRTIRVSDKLAAGPCYGRHLQSYMLREEEFCMQTDSHMDVVKHWDEKMLQMWGRVDNEYGILTTYVHRIEQIHAGAENRREVPHLCQLSFTDKLHYPRYVQAKLAAKLPRPKLTTTWAAGMSFAKCHAWKASPYDPGLRMVFDGEEFSMHARLWTRGYDTYTPDKSLIGHDYNGIKDGPAPSSWLNNPVTAGTKKKSYDRMFTLFGMPGKVDTPAMWDSIGKYGLGTKRTLEQYQEFIGVNFTTLEILGSRCGTVRYVPFEEGEWPPTENNLGGPYWSRRLNRRGVHAEGYKSPFRLSGQRFRRDSAGMLIDMDGTQYGGSGFFSLGSLVTVFGFLLVMACCCSSIVRCAVPQGHHRSNAPGRSNRFSRNGNVLPP